MDVQKGYTLLELLVVLALIAIVLILAYPYMQETFYASESTRAEQQFINALRQARAYSHIKRQDVVVCTVNAQGLCDRQADQSLLVFIDVNRNNQKDDQDVVLSRADWQLRHGRIILRTSAARGYIRYMGDTAKPRGHFGHLRYCSPSANPRLSFKIVVNAYAAVRTERGDAVDVGCGEE